MADLKLKYGTAWTDLTITLASLASDSNLLAGRESTVVDNSSDLFIDALLGGKITTGTSPTDAKTIEVWAYGENLDDDVYNDVLDGTDSAETITSNDIKNAALKLAQIIKTNNTSDRIYLFGPISLASLFSGLVPRKWGVFVTHDTGVNLNSTGGNHQFSYRGIHGQSV